MQQRLAARNRHSRRATFIDRPETFFRRKLRLQHMRRILNFPAARARQITAEQRLQHQHPRILLPSPELLPQDVTLRSPHLRNWYRHSSTPPYRPNPPILSFRGAKQRGICLSPASTRKPILANYPIRRTPVPCAAPTIALA